ncbi:MAG: 23S rRNA (guanosine(2251)-2'-O)-methyltransferase RlmB [Anaerolineae bacterium]
MEVLAGRNSVYEALRAGRRQVHRVLVARGAQERETLADLVALAAERGLPVSYVDRAQLDRAAGALHHQGVIAEGEGYPYVSAADMLALASERQEPPLLLALDGVQDPQNVGTLLRTAEAVGVHGVLLPQRRAVHITPAVSRASAGAVEHLYIAIVPNMVRAIEGLKGAGVWAVGVEDHPDAQDYGLVDLDMALVLVLGGEGEGLHRLAAERCDLLVRLPMRGQINSLNVAVAGSIMLYRAWQARQSGP